MQDRLKSIGITALGSGLVFAVLSGKGGRKTGFMLGAAIGAVAGLIVNPLGKGKQNK
jgi:hypothetical protein